MVKTAQIKKTIAGLATTATYFYLVAAAYAQPASGRPLITAPTGTVDPNTSVENIPTLLVNIISALAIVLAVLYLMFGGIKLITAKGDRAAVESARKHIFSAVIGLVVVFGTFLIIQFIFNLLGTDNPLKSGFSLKNLQNVNSSPTP